MDLPNRHTLSICLATLSDNMMFKSSGKPEDASPLTLDVSIAYEASETPKAPKIGLALNVEL